MTITSSARIIRRPAHYVRTHINMSLSKGIRLRGKGRDQAVERNRTHVEKGPVSPGCIKCSANVSTGPQAWSTLWPRCHILPPLVGFLSDREHFKREMGALVSIHKEISLTYILKFFSTTIQRESPLPTPSLCMPRVKDLL